MHWSEARGFGDSSCVREEHYPPRPCLRVVAEKTSLWGGCQPVASEQEDRLRAALPFRAAEDRVVALLLLTGRRPAQTVGLRAPDHGSGDRNDGIGVAATLPPALAKLPTMSAVSETRSASTETQRTKL